MARYSAVSFVLLIGLLIALPVWMGLCDQVQNIGTSLDHYAERKWPVLGDAFARWLPMPANTLVNLGYLGVGIHWLRKLAAQQQILNGRSPNDLYMIEVFAWMAICYSGVQTVRVLTLSHRWGVLDQWYTPPIFAWVAAWAMHILHGWNANRSSIIITVSSTSYLLIALAFYGFEIALAANIALAVIYGVKVLLAYKDKQSQISGAFMKAILSCVGFVVLKLLDHSLPLLHPLFHYISGHFLSKVCDFLQIHYVLDFMHLVTVEKLKSKTI